VTRGALVDHVTAGGPADRAGVRGGTGRETYLGEAVVTGGDVVVAIDGRAVASGDDLVRIVTNVLEPGRIARFTLVRRGRRLTMPVHVAARRTR
jgi:S1-C subfamily serine protease